MKGIFVNSMKKKIIFIIYLLLISVITVFSVTKADYNWDVLAYAGCVFSFESTNADTVHKSAYELFKNTVDEKTYLLQTAGNKYRETLSECTDCFYQTLPFYKIKLLYIILIYGLYKSGINLFFSLAVISGLFYFLTSLVIYLWLWKIIRDEFYSFLPAVFLSVSPYLINASSNPTPDLLAGFFIFLAVFILLERNNFYLFALLMVLSLFVRPDNIFLFAILIGVLITNNQYSKHRKLMYLSISLGALIVVITNIWSGNYSYSTLFYHSFVEKLTKPAEFNSIINPSIYIKGLLNWVFFFKYSMAALQFVILSIAIYIKIHSDDEIKNDLEFLVLIAMGLSIIIHYILYPVMDDRYFIAQYLVIDILFIKSIYSRHNLTVQKAYKHSSHV